MQNPIRREYLPRVCFFDGSVVVFTHGFQKKTRKTPRIEIEKAESYRSDYLHRREK